MFTLMKFYRYSETVIIVIKFRIGWVAATVKIASATWMNKQSAYFSTQHYVQNENCHHI